MSQARLREALNAGGPGSKDKTPPVADGILSVTPDTPEAEEWKNRRSAIDSAAACSTYLDDEEDAGPQPSDLYGKFTWKIEKFSEISKRELRSTVFEVGNYKWYILVYPQGCDVCNHLSLFLCVADYDKLLPGWSHFAQFTIAVVNKDPKKSKYSDTLHRFCKKEHDWGWKKFMELSKILEGFTVQDTLVIKAQVQVIRDRVNRPFRCLDPQYRRELVRVYLTNVEGICRRFMEEKRDKLQRLQTEVGFTNFWSSLDGRQQRALIQEKGETLLKGLVKRFFNEKEVTSTLVMDALYCGSKQLEEAGRLYMQGNLKGPAPLILVDADKNLLVLNGEILEVLEKAVCDNLPPMRDEKAGDALAVRSAQDSDEYNKDSVERDERRLAELGKRTVEIYSLAYVFFERVEAAYNEAESIKRQDALIREEEELERLEDERAAVRAAADKEKKARKKERKKAKKEAERARREAEEVERKRMEDQRREEVERKQREAMERRRQEEEQNKVVVAKAKEIVKPAPKPKPKAPAKPPERIASRDDSDKPETSVKSREEYYEVDRALTQDEERAQAQAELVSSTSCSNYRRSTSDSALSNASSTEADACPEDVENESTASTDEEVATLRAHITWLEGELAQKETEIFELRARVAELQAGDTATTTTLNSVSCYTVDAASGSSSDSSRPPSRTDSQEDSVQLKSQTSSRPASASETTPAAATANGAAVQENGVAHSHYNPHRGLNPSAVAYRSHSVPVPGISAPMEGLAAATSHAMAHARPAAMLHPSPTAFTLGPPPFLPLSTAGVPPQEQQQQHSGLSHRGKPGSRVPMGNGHLPGRPVGAPAQMMSGMSRQDSKSMGLHRSSSDGKGVNIASSTAYAGPMPPSVNMSGRNMGMGNLGMGGPSVSDTMLSYRNAAMNAGVMPMAPLQSQPPPGSANVSSPSQRHMPNNQHAPPGAGGPRMPQHLPNGKGPFGPPPQLVVQAHRQAGPAGLQFAPPQHTNKPAMAYPSNKRVDNGGAVDSPGLDDFAHMGLITDLLE